MSYIDQTDKVICTQDNQIIESCYSMTLIEKRLLLFAISKIDPTQFPKAHIPLVVSIDTNEWVKYYPDKTPWRALKRAATDLLRRHVTFHPKTGVIEKVNWFSSVHYYEGEGYLKIEFTRPMQVRLAGMLEQFTKVDLLSVSKLKSIYSIRLYELLSQWISTGYRIISLEDFRFAMDCVDSYKENKSLKLWVIKPAMKEINNKTNLTVSLENVKRGRKITAFKFIFSENEQEDLFK